MKNLLFIAISILAVGCGGKDESTTETKPVEEKVVEVNEEVKNKETVAETKPELEGVNHFELEERKGIRYLKNSDAPYTGKVFTLYENGQKNIEANLKDGLLDGLISNWYENGQKMIEGNYKDDKLDGLEVSWYESGKKRGEINYKDGKWDGLQRTWHENGQKQFEAKYKDGKKDGLWLAWHENGQTKIERNFKDNIESSVKYWNSKGEPVDSLEEAK